MVGMVHGIELAVRVPAVAPCVAVRMVDVPARSLIMKFAEGMEQKYSLPGCPDRRSILLILMRVWTEYG